jgi:hypothetical protein
MDESWRMGTSGRRGRGNARLLVAYIVKKGEPRRIEASQSPSVTCQAFLASERLGRKTPGSG